MTHPSPYTPRVPCWRCKGRRVVIDPTITEFVALVPCPSCSHRDPPGRHAQHEHFETMATAA